MELDCSGCREEEGGTNVMSFPLRQNSFVKFLVSCAPPFSGQTYLARFLVRLASVQTFISFPRPLNH